MSKVAHQAGVFLGFSSKKLLGVSLLSPGNDASPSQGYPQHDIGGERGTIRLKTTTQCPWSGFEPGPLTPDLSALF